MPCLIKSDMHHPWLCIMPCLCLCVYHVACFFPVCFSRYLRFRSGVVRIRSTTSVCLLHALVLLPSGISGKMTVTLDLTTIIAMLVASFYRYAALPITCSSRLPNCHEPLTLPPFLANHCLAMLPLCSAPLIALLAAGEDEDCSMLDYVYVGISQCLLYYLMHLYTW